MCSFVALIAAMQASSKRRNGRRQIYLAHRSATCFRFALSIDLRDSLPDGQMKYENTKTQRYKDTLRKVGIRNSRT